MKKSKTAFSPQESYSPEFKLRIVLEYVRSPRRKKHICRENNISAELLEAWHQEFSNRAAAIFSSSSSFPVQVQSARENATADVEHSTLPAWGMRINKSWQNSIRSPSTTQEKPKWLKGFDAEDWDKRGVIVWDNTAQIFAFASASQALKLLEVLRTTKRWKKKGIPATRRGFALDAEQESKAKRVRTRSNPDGASSDKIEFTLSPEVSLECFAFLEEHASLLCELEQKDEKEQSTVLTKMYGMLFRIGHEADEKKIDLAARPLPWEHDAEKHLWVCNQPPNRGIVMLTKDNWFWQGFIEQPDRFKHESPLFLELEQALAWIEEQLLALKNLPPEDAASKPESFREPFEPETDLTAFWIDPAVLEPERKLFRVVILLHCNPESSKTMEMSFGKLMHYDEKYSTPSKLLRELHMDGAPITMEQIAAPYSGLYQVYSAAMYYQEAVAQQQAQQCWDQSTIVQKYKEGKIEWAKYGYEEVDTNYCTWMGMLQSPDHFPDAPSSREEHMQQKAMGLTLIHALELEDYRQFLQLPRRGVSDEKLLMTMHEKRAKSKYIPAAARAESEQWLREHSKKSSE